MNKKIILAFLAVLSLTAFPAFAQINRYDSTGGAAVAGFAAVFGIIMIAFLLIALVSIIMLIIALISILSSNNDSNWKIIWVLICLFGGPIGTTIYFIFGKKTKIGGSQQFQQSPSPPKLVNPQLVAYIRDNKNQYPVEALKGKLRSLGYSEIDIRDAVEEAMKQPPLLK